MLPLRKAAVFVLSMFLSVRDSLSVDEDVHHAVIHLIVTSVSSLCRGQRQQRPSQIQSSDWLTEAGD